MIVVIVVAALVGLARGGSFHNLAQLELPGWPLVFAGVVVQALGAFAATIGLPAASTWYVAGMVVSALCVVVFVARNRYVPGMPLVAFGFALNALVVALNGAMPVDAAAVRRIGLSTIGLERGDDAKHELRDDGTILPLLSDVIPVPLPLPWGSNVVSVGDVVLAAGIGVLVTRAMLKRPPAHLPGSPPAPPPPPPSHVL